MRDQITTAFEVLGLVLIVVAVGMEVTSLVNLAAGLAVSGVLLLGCSALVVARTPKPRPGEETA